MNTLQERFRKVLFLNQMLVTHDVISSTVSDFQIDGVTFEVGGHGKGKRQISGPAEAYVVKDDIEYGAGNIIPLWHSGLCY